MYKMSIEVKTQFEGLHCWPDAPHDVAFLRNMHRHMFHIVLRIPVEHGDRDLEFIMVKRALDKFVKNRYYSDDNVAYLGRRSCEDIGSDVLAWSYTKYGRIGVEVGVFEDGENGCWVTEEAGGATASES